MHAEKCAPGPMVFTFFLFFWRLSKIPKCNCGAKKKGKASRPTVVVESWTPWSPGPPGVLARDGPECSRASICSAPLSKWDAFKWSYIQVFKLSSLLFSSFVEFKFCSLRFVSLTSVHLDSVHFTFSGFSSLNLFSVQFNLVKHFRPPKVITFHSVWSQF